MSEPVLLSPVFHLFAPIVVAIAEECLVSNRLYRTSAVYYTIYKGMHNRQYIGRGGGVPTDVIKFALWREEKLVLRCYLIEIVFLKRIKS